MRRILLLLLVGLLLCGCMPMAEESDHRKQDFLAAESRSPEELALLAKKTVLLDAGHGFEDPGCEYPDNGIIERELNLLLAQKIASALRAHDVTVILTHNGESFPGREDLDALASEKGYDLTAYLHALISAYSGREGDALENTVTAFGQGVNGDGVYDTFERAYYANLLGGDLFVSVHINASGTNAYAVGSDLFVCGDTPHGEASSALMASMKASLCYAFPARRVGAREDGWDDAFVVTKYTDMPAILVEAGFASNDEDAKLLTDPAWQDAFAVAVAEGIEMYLLGY